MRSIGQFNGAERDEISGPDCPLIFLETFEKYREIKFVQRVTDKKLILYPRAMLTWVDLNAYKNSTGRGISMLECEIIMGLDGIFEGREDD